MWQQQGFDINQIRRFIAFCKLIGSMACNLIDCGLCNARLKSICLLKRSYVGCRGRICRGMREKSVEAYLACGSAGVPSFNHAFGPSDAARWPGALWCRDDWAMRQAVLESLQEVPAWGSDARIAKALLVVAPVPRFT
jgi:hypothetical protein